MVNEHKRKPPTAIPAGRRAFYIGRDGRGCGVQRGTGLYGLSVDIGAYAWYDMDIDKHTRGCAMATAVLYIRVSTEEQAEHGVSLAAQEERLLGYCRMTGLEAQKVIREEGVSGAKVLASRPGGQELLRMLAKGKAGHVVALRLDRLFRDAADALVQTKEWDRAGIALHLVDMGGQAVNTASAMGRMMLTMMAGFAELERNLIAERTRVAMAHKKEHLQAYGSTPFGYERRGDRLVEHGGELEVIADVTAWRKAGLSLRAIADQLTQLGIATKQGGRWHASTVKYLLANDLYAQVVAL